VSHAQSAPSQRVVVEVDAGAGSTLDASSTRRLIAREVGDIDLPPMPSREVHDVILYFRVVESADGATRIELWERGAYYGARTISTRGSPRLRPRRIALAAAELARRLKQRRIAEARRLAADERRRLEREELARRTPPFARSAFFAGTDGAWTTGGRLWMLGPRLGTEVRFGSGFRLSAAGAWRFGRVSGLDSAPSVQWMEIEVAPGYLLLHDPRLDVLVDVPLSANVLRLGDGASTDGVTLHAESWSARAGLSPRIEPRFGAFRLSVGPAVGIVLHPVRVVDGGRSTVVRGISLGGTLSLVFDPSVRP
jgi:hypothetical protein